MQLRRICYAVGAALIVSGLVHLAVLIIGGGTWSARACADGRSARSRSPA